MATPSGGRSSDRRVLVGIDLGTSHMKIGVFDSEGSALAGHSARVPMIRPALGHHEQDPSAWWNLVCEGLHRIEADSPGLLGDVAVISVCGHSHGPTPYAEGRGALANCITWLDQRGGDEVSWMLSEIGEEPFRVEGNMVVDTCYTAAKLLWMKRHRPKIYRDADVFLLPKDTLVHRLTGVYSTDFTDVSVTNLYSAGRQDWSETLVQRCGLDIDKLPPVHRAWEIVGGVTADAARETPLREGTPVIAGAADWACLYYGAGGVRPGVVIDLAGTVGGVMVTTEAGVDLPGMPSLVPGLRNCIPGCLEASSVIYQWFADELGARDVVGGTTARLERMNAEAEAVPPGSEGLLVLPHFAGARRPQKENSKGVILGLTLGTTRGAIARAIIEGVAYETRRAVERVLNVGMEVKTVRAIGGGARSALWRQIKADVNGLPYCTLNQFEAGAFGAAMVGGFAIGVYPTLEDPIDRLVRTENETRPRAEHRAVYDDMYRAYCRFSDAMEAGGMYDEIDEIVKRETSRRASLNGRKELDT